MLETLPRQWTSAQVSQFLRQVYLGLFGVYALICILGYSLYPHTNIDFLNNFEPHDKLVWMVRLIFLVVISSAIPLNLLPVRTSLALRLKARQQTPLDETLLGSPASDSRYTWPLGCALVFSSSLLAHFVGSLQTVMNVVGGFFAATVMFTMPFLLMFQLPIPRWRRMCLQASMLVLALVGYASGMLDTWHYLTRLMA